MNNPTFVSRSVSCNYRSQCTHFHLNVVQHWFDGFALILFTPPLPRGYSDESGEFDALFPILISIVGPRIFSVKLCYSLIFLMKSLSTTGLVIFSMTQNSPCFLSNLRSFEGIDLPPPCIISTALIGLNRDGWFFSPPTLPYQPKTACWDVPLLPCKLSLY